MIGWILGLLLLAIVALAVYVRLAPVDVAKWHNATLPAKEAGEYPSEGGFVGQYTLEGDGKAALARLHSVAVATPRTKVVAGDVEARRITYETRSAVMGFPDYTTVTLTQVPETGRAMLQVNARLRFGQKDFGVNGARVKSWIAAAGL